VDQCFDGAGGCPRIEREFVVKDRSGRVRRGASSFPSGASGCCYWIESWSNRTPRAGWSLLTSGEKRAVGARPAAMGDPLSFARI
jgi:hypothetical protein